MSDHYHYDYAQTHHDHGDYSDRYHDHDYAETHHRHYDAESVAAGLREDLGHAESRIRDLEDGLIDALTRIRELEAETAAHGEVLEGVRNRVYRLEHGLSDGDDE